MISSLVPALIFCLQGLSRAGSRARRTNFNALDVQFILEPSLRLDRIEHLDRLRHTLARHRPKLLVLDPYVRLQRVDENDATKVSAVLAALRELSRTFWLAIILVHHTRKNSSDKPGLALRGSSDFHAWGDSNLYLRPQRGDLILTSEHRFAAPAPPLGLTLVAEETPVRLEVILENAPDDISSFGERILVSLGARPRRQDELRRELRIRNQKLTDILGVVAPLWLRAKCASCGGRGMFDHEVSQAQPVQAREAEEVPRSQLGGIQRRAAPPRRFDGLV